jgi:hypothetical protein
MAYNDQVDPTESPGINRSAAGPEHGQREPAQNVSQIQAWAQQYLGRQFSLQDLNAHLANPGGLAAVQIAHSELAGSAGLRGLAARTTTILARLIRRRWWSRRRGISASAVGAATRHASADFHTAGLHTAARVQLRRFRRARSEQAERRSAVQIHDGARAGRHLETCRGEWWIVHGGTYDALMRNASRHCGRRLPASVRPRHADLHQRTAATRIQNYNTNYGTQYKDP